MGLPPDGKLSVKFFWAEGPKGRRLKKLTASTKNESYAVAPTLLISSTKLSKFQDPQQLPPLVDGVAQATGHTLLPPNASAPHVTHPLILPRKSITTFQFKSAAARSQLLAPRLSRACPSSSPVITVGAAERLHPPLPARRASNSFPVNALALRWR